MKEAPPLPGGSLLATAGCGFLRRRPAPRMRAPRIVTLLFTDVERSTRLLGALSYLRRWISASALSSDAARAQKGTDIHGCDAIFIFGSAGDAVGAAVEARAPSRPSIAARHAVRVRMATAPRDRRGGDELFGMALHQASRIMALTWRAVVVSAPRSRSPSSWHQTSRCSTSECTGCAISSGRFGSPAVAEGIATYFPPLKTATVGASRLPAPTTSFIGRERELHELIDVLAARRLVTLTGAGGSGKTRLALEVARRVEDRHRDGVCLVELAGLGTDALVPEAVLGAFGMREPRRARRRPSSCAPRWPTTTRSSCSTTASTCRRGGRARRCAAARVLPTAHAGNQPGAIAPAGRGRATGPAAGPAGTGGARVAGTARRIRRLQAPGRAWHDVRPGFRLTDGNSAAVARICGGARGLPLAIELAAAAAHARPGAVGPRLGEQLDLLAHGGHSPPDRQQTIRAALD